MSDHEATGGNHNPTTTTCVVGADGVTSGLHSDPGGGTGAVNRTAPSVEQLKSVIDALLAALCAKFGPRSSAVLILGMPIDQNSGHDRFVANYYGPCLTSRGLLAWGSAAVERLIDAQDTSRNGKPHP